MLARKQIPNRRYVYVPGNLPREIVAEVWRVVSPKETVVTADDKDMLPPMSVDRVHRHVHDGTTVLHLFTAKPRRVPESVTA